METILLFAPLVGAIICGFSWRLIGEQARILDFAAPLVKPGGVLLYATCALVDREGRPERALDELRDLAHAGRFRHPPGDTRRHVTRQAQRGDRRVGRSPCRARCR